MDGLRAHEVANYAGERFSLIFFTRRGWEKADAEALETLERCLFPVPTIETAKGIDSWLAPANTEGTKHQQWLSEHDRPETTVSTGIFRGGG